MGHPGARLNGLIVRELTVEQLKCDTTTVHLKHPRLMLQSALSECRGDELCLSG